MYDYCIIGSGPAGLTLAHELSNTGKKICIIESGLKNLDPNKNSLKKVISVGEIKIKDNSRERAFGGTSNTWSALSAPLDPIDFEKWQIKFYDLETSYRRLADYGFPKLEDFNIESFDNLKKRSDFLMPLGRLQEKIFIAPQPPTNFGEKFNDLITKENIKVLFDSTVIKINGNSKIESLDLINSNNEKSVIKAEVFIICAGGIESPRLLLVSNIGNENNQVGKYLMNHPKGTLGVLELNTPIRKAPYLFGDKHKNFYSYMGVRVRESLQKENKILNSYLRLEPIISNSFLQRVFNKIGLPNIAPITKLKVRNFMEMEPDPLNAMTLGKEVDVYGVPLPVVNINTTNLDKKSLIELHRMFKEEMEKNNLGKFISNLENVSPWPITTDASHHLGGTIMGIDKDNSVVDINLKVHSTDNLYVCSGSVFPTSGCTNPTYTICALAIRLADHLKAKSSVS